MQLDHIKLEKLKSSTINMRHSAKKPDVSDILPSIRARGILVPLIVRPNCEADKFEVVAGNRRFTAAQIVKDEAGDIDPLPCAIIDKGDDAAALEASILENLARLAPDPMTQYEAFANLKKEGRSIAEIAETFGTTELMVQRRLALGNLIPAIRKAFRQELIDNETIKHLTLASVKQQRDWWNLFKDKKSSAPTGYRLKGWFFGGQQIATSVALFDLKDYKGTTVNDMFNEDEYFSDTDKFWELQNTAIAAKAKAYEADGWRTVHILDAGRHFATWEYADADKGDGADVYIEVKHDGSVKCHEGLISEKEYKKRERAKTSGEKMPTSERGVKPEVSKVMQNYIALHRHAAVQDALAGAPAIALRLTLAHMIVGTSKWSVVADGPKPKTEAIAASVAASRGRISFDAQRPAVLALLNLPAHQTQVLSRTPSSEKTAIIFAALLNHSDTVVMKIMAFVMAESLASNTRLVEAVGNVLSVDMSAYFTPDDTFLALLREKPTINAILKELGGKSVADGNVSATGKVQKGIIADYMNGTNGRKQVKGWLPKLMQFPMSAYTKNGGIDLMYGWQTIAKHFKPKAETKAPKTETKVSPIKKKPAAQKKAA